jgi:hypothetical protein
MAAKLVKLTHKIAIQLHLVAESCTIYSSRSRRPVRKLLDTLPVNDVIHRHDIKDELMEVKRWDVEQICHLADT